MSSQPFPFLAAADKEKPKIPNLTQTMIKYHIFPTFVRVTEPLTHHASPEFIGYLKGVMKNLRHFSHRTKNKKSEAIQTACLENEKSLWRKNHEQTAMIHRRFVCFFVFTLSISFIWCFVESYFAIQSPVWKCCLNSKHWK